MIFIFLPTKLLQISYLWDFLWNEKKLSLHKCYTILRTLEPRLFISKRFVKETLFPSFPIIHLSFDIYISFYPLHFQRSPNIFTWYTFTHSPTSMSINLKSSPSIPSTRGHGESIRVIAHHSSLESIIFEITRRLVWYWTRSKEIVQGTDGTKTRWSAARRLQLRASIDPEKQVSVVVDSGHREWIFDATCCYPSSSFFLSFPPLEVFHFRLLSTKHPEYLFYYFTTILYMYVYLMK